MVTAGREVAVEIVRVLRAQGFVAVLAGGCVRDELLGLVPKDYDVATDAGPERVEKLFPGTREVGKVFGVVPVVRKVRGERVVVEVATFREELKRGCARHRVELVPLVTDQPYAEALAQFLTARRRRG